jgi:hypothetical protein
MEAHSPQAKGRIERSNRIYQDRLVKELRLTSISEIKSANRLLHGGFLASRSKPICSSTSMRPRGSGSAGQAISSRLTKLVWAGPEKAGVGTRYRVRQRRAQV